VCCRFNFKINYGYALTPYVACMFHLFPKDLIVKIGFLLYKKDRANLFACCHFLKNIADRTFYLKHLEFRRRLHEHMKKEKSMLVVTLKKRVYGSPDEFWFAVLVKSKNIFPRPCCRLTFTEWRDYSDHLFSGGYWGFQGDSYGRLYVDRFDILGKNCEMAFYDYTDQELWDNNDGKNYFIENQSYIPNGYGDYDEILYGWCPDDYYDRIDYLYEYI
jgi:hypothetical protein